MIQTFSTTWPCET